MSHLGACESRLTEEKVNNIRTEKGTKQVLNSIKKKKTRDKKNQHTENKEKILVSCFSVKLMSYSVYSLDFF